MVGDISFNLRGFYERKVVKCIFLMQQIITLFLQKKEKLYEYYGIPYGVIDGSS